MTMFKLEIVLFFLLCSPMVYANPTKSPFEGDWYWNSDYPNATFSLTMTHKNNRLIGRYSCIALGGNRIDGPMYKKDADSFSLPIPKGNTFTSKLYLSYSNGIGKVKITVKGDTLYWEATDLSADLFCPKKALLNREE